MGQDLHFFLEISICFCFHLSMSCRLSTWPGFLSWDSSHISSGPSRSVHRSPSFQSQFRTIRGFPWKLDASTQSLELPFFSQAHILPLYYFFISYIIQHYSLNHSLLSRIIYFLKVQLQKCCHGSSQFANVLPFVKISSFAMHQ